MKIKKMIKRIFLRIIVKNRLQEIEQNLFSEIYSIKKDLILFSFVLMFYHIILLYFVLLLSDGTYGYFYIQKYDWLYTNIYPVFICIENLFFFFILFIHIFLKQSKAYNIFGKKKTKNKKLKKMECVRNSNGIILHTIEG